MITSNSDCPICMEKLINKIQILPCSHRMHTKCIINLSSSTCPTKHKCPLCRSPIIMIYNNVSQRYIMPISIMPISIIPINILIISLCSNRFLIYTFVSNVFIFYMLFHFCNTVMKDN